MSGTTHGGFRARRLGPLRLMLLPSPPPHPAGLSAVLSHSAEPWVMAPACGCRLEGVGCSVGPVAMIQEVCFSNMCGLIQAAAHVSHPCSSASPQPSHRPVSSCTPTSHTQQRSTGRRPEKTRTDLRSTREHQGELHRPIHACARSVGTAFICTAEHRYACAFAQRARPSGAS